MTVQVRLVPRSYVQVRQMGSGPAGQDGWTPSFAIELDGERRVLRVIDWVGGEGTKPQTGWYVGVTGLVEAVADAVDIRGLQGWAGWSPVFAIASDGLRRVLRLVDWAGGAGPKPPITGSGGAPRYLGSAGFVTDPAQAIDVRGPLGPAGWSPSFAVVNDGARRVLRLADWVGGEGSKPPVLSGGNPQYVGSAGFVTDITQAIDIRGPQGPASPASVVTVTPTGNIASTDVQAALAELDNEKAPLVHGHSIAQVTGLQAALDGKANLDENSLVVPAGTTAQRPMTPQISVRYNTERAKLEMWNGAAWKDAGGGPSVGSDSIIRTNATVISENITIPDNTNGSTVGPVTIAAGYTVAVGNGSTWVIL